MKKIIQLLILCILGAPVLAQPIRVLIKEVEGRELNNPLFKPVPEANYRLEATGLTIPFLETFNYLNTHDFYANWDTSNVEIVKVIDGPAANAVKFNGIKRDKSRYSTDSSVRVPTDVLISKPINSTGFLVDSLSFIEFEWQGGGTGLQPDYESGDSLVLYLMNQSGQFIKIWKSPANRTFDKSRFYKEKLFILNPEFSHGNLQFKFQAFGPSLSNTSAWFITNLSISLPATLINLWKI